LKRLFAQRKKERKWERAVPPEDQEGTDGKAFGGSYWTEKPEKGSFKYSIVRGK